MLGGIFFFKLFNESPIGQFRNRAHAVSEKGAVEMIKFMLPDAGQISDEKAEDLIERRVDFSPAYFICR